MRVRYVVYTSHLADPAGPALVPGIIRAARANNAIRGITGALIYDGERFCQYIEGAPDEMERTYDAIRNDPRHDRIEVLASGDAPSQRFADWSMGFVYAALPALIDRLSERPVGSVADAFENALADCDIEA